MSVVSASELSREALTDAPEGEYINVMLENSNSFVRQTVKAFRRGITTEDNTPNTEKVLNLTHDVEVEVANPMDVPVKGIYALQCEGLTLDSMGAPTGAVYSLNKPHISWRPTGKESGSVYVKATYDLNHTGESMEMTRTTDQELSSGEEGPVIWTSTEHSIGSGITHSGGTFTCAEAGVYLVTFQVHINGGNFIIAEAWIQSNSKRYGQEYNGDPSIEAFLRNMSFPITVSAGGTIYCVVYQDDGALGIRYIDGTSLNKARVSVQRLYNATVPVGRINLFFYGG